MHGSRKLCGALTECQRTTTPGQCGSINSERVLLDLRRRVEGQTGRFWCCVQSEVRKNQNIMPQCLCLSPSSCCSHSDEARGVQLGAQSLLNTHVHKSETPAEALRCRPHYYISTLTGTGQTLHISHMAERLREGDMWKGRRRKEAAGDEGAKE